MPGLGCVVHSPVLPGIACTPQKGPSAQAWKQSLGPYCRAVARGARRAFLVGDLPFGSYETSVRDAVVSATRLLKEGQMDAVKLEGAWACSLRRRSHCEARGTWC